MKATKVTAGLAESNGRLLLGIWRDSLHVTCGLTACTPGSAAGPTLGNEYGKTLPFLPFPHQRRGTKRLTMSEAVRLAKPRGFTGHINDITLTTDRCLCVYYADAYNV